VKFTRSGAFVDLPITVPCGQCIGCRLEKSRQWAIRMMHETESHSASCFLTLSYSDENLPSDNALDVEHVKLFLKRLRKKIGPVRYYHCGEYGELHGRPHYHMALFGHDFSADRTLFSTEGGNQLFTSRSLSDLWSLGFCSVGSLDFDSAAYVARYVTKKVTGDQAEEEYGQVNPVTGEVTLKKKPYATMSLKPGIGFEYFQRWKHQIYPRDTVLVRGRLEQPPAYYDVLMEREDPELMKRVKRKRFAKLKDMDPNEQTHERLATREKCRLLAGKVFAREPGRRS